MGFLSFFTGKPSAVAPVPAIRSEAYGGTSNNRLRKDQAWVRSFPTDEDRNIGAWGRAKLRLECRDQVRNNSIAAGLIERFQDYTVGPDGLIPQAKTSDPAWNKAAEQYFREWCKVADYRGRANFAGLLRMAEASTFDAGECFFILTDNGKLQPIEAERVATPVKLQRDSSIIDGVKLSADGIVEGYYVLTRGEGGYASNGNPFEFVEARDMIHFTSPSFRFDQIRGTPRLAACLNSMRDYGMFQDATLKTAELQAGIALIRNTAAGAAGAFGAGPRDATPASTERKQKEEYFAHGMIINGERGDEIKGLSPSTPGPQFEGFSLHKLREYGARFGIPYEMLFLDFQKGSFAQSKAALIVTYKKMEVDQCRLRDVICQRVWNWKIAQAIKRGDLPPAPVNDAGYSDWYNVVWQFPGHEWIQPGDQIAADKEAYRIGSKCLADITRVGGRDYEDVLTDKAVEIARAQQIVIANGLDKFGLTWRDLIDSATNSQRPMEPAKSEPEEKDEENEP